MTDSRLPRITSYMTRAERGTRWGRCLDEELVLRLVEIRKIPLGHLTITSDRIHRRGAKGYLAVYAICSECSQTSEIDVRNIETGNTTECRCLRRVRYGRDLRAATLSERFSAIKQRCETPHYPGYQNYGGRGIENRFKDSRHFITYVLRYLPHPTYEGIDIGRKDNNGHYEPGNLRLETRAINARNKRTNRWTIYKRKHVIASDLYNFLVRDYPEFRLSRQRTATLAAAGVSWEEILKRRARGPYKKKQRSTTS